MKSSFYHTHSFQTKYLNLDYKPRIFLQIRLTNQLLQSKSKVFNTYISPYYLYYCLLNLEETILIVLHFNVCLYFNHYKQYLDL